MGFKDVLKVLSGIGILSYVGKDAPKSEIEEIEFENPKVTEGNAVPVIFGTCRVDSPDVAWFGNVDSQEEKKDGERIAYKYYAGFHLILCQAPVDVFRKIWVDDVLIYSVFKDGEPSSLGLINISKADCFGGREQDGGISGYITLANGNPSQATNSYLETVLTAPIPAFRGVASLIAHQIYIGTRNQLKKWSIQLSRIHYTDDYQTQWYDEKAEIISSTVLIDGDDTDFSYQITAYDDTQIGFGIDDIPTTGWDTNEPGAFGDIDGGWTPPYTVETSWPSTTDGSTLWFKKQIEHDGKSDIKVSGMRPAESLHWMAVQYGNYPPGDFIFYAEDATHPDSDDFVYFEHVIDGNELIAGRISFIARMTEKSTQPSSVGQTYAWMKVETLEVPTMNPVHAIREILTNRVFGRGFAEAEIGDSFDDAADTVYDEGTGICLKWEKTTAAYEAIEEIKRHINAEVFPSRTTGKWEIKLVRKDYTTLTIPRFDDDEIKDVTNIKRQSIHELYNTVSITYENMSMGVTNTITYQDLALVYQMGGVVRKEVKYDGFVTPNSANKAVARDMRIESTSKTSCNLTVNRQAVDLNLGDAFILHLPEKGFDEAVMRVTEITLPDGVNKEIYIKCISDVFESPTVNYIVDAPGDGITQVSNPGIIKHRINQEEPYFSLVEKFGKVTTDILLDNSNDLGYLMAAGAKTSPNYTVADIWRSANAYGYLSIGDNQLCPCVVLDEDIGKMDATFEVVADINVNHLSKIENFEWLQIGSEFMSIVSVSLGTPNTITVKRGIWDTVPIPHEASDYVFLWHDYQLHDAREYQKNEYANIKFLTRTAVATLPISQDNAGTVIFESRAWRPYPPADFTLNSEYFPDYLDPSSDILVEWVHRDRNDSTMRGFLDASVTPESGTTYIVRLRDPSDLSIIYQESGIDGLSHTIPYGAIELASPGIESVRIELASVRNGYESYTQQYHEFSVADGRITEEDDPRITEESVQRIV